MNNHFNNITEGKTYKKLIEIVSMVTGMEGDEINPELDLFSFGLDSLSLMALGKQIDKVFSINISLEELVTEYNSLIKISEYLEKNFAEVDLTDEQRKDITVKEEEVINISTDIDDYKPKTYQESSGFEKIDMKEQVNIDVYQLFNNQVLVMKEQNEILMRMANSMKSNGMTINKSNDGAKKEEEKDTAKGAGSNKSSEKSNFYMPYKPLKLNKSTNFSNDQLSFINKTETEYTTITKASKKLTDEYRKVHAEWRNTSGFNATYKEIIYPIYAKKGKGSSITDVDNNELIDVTMGFGVNLFGNNPDFVQNALRKAMDENAAPLGPLEELPCKVAEKIYELTGNERVFFANTGTEADMFAVRLARAVTGKQKVIAFKGSYHGSYDGFLGISYKDASGNVATLPMAPGVTDNVVKDLILLEYDLDESLTYIKEHINEIAAVIVEPVQSRRPDIQPKEFLHKLRKITSDGNAALIFDEIVLGFRIAPGGAQEYFDVKADIVTYGKVVGGGLPIGIVAGDAKFLDSIDGGEWRYGDNSVPDASARRTFVGGTFCHNHYTMTAANAVLDYIIQNKSNMYINLNNITKYLVDSLNSFFKEEKISIEVSSFCSMFKFNMDSDMEIFYYSLLKKGVYIWEGRTCFLSTEHTMEDVDKIIIAVKETVLEMKDAGFFLLTEKSKNDIDSNIIYSVNEDDKIIPMSLIQQRLYSQIFLNNGVDPFDMIGVFEVKGHLQIDILQQTLNKIIDQNEILRTSLHLKNGEFRQQIHEKVEVEIKQIFQNNKMVLQEYIDQCISKFQLDKVPLIEALLIHTFDKKKILVFHMHHSISDGISFEILVSQIVAGCNGKEWTQGKQYRHFVNWENNYLKSSMLLEDQGFWRDALEGVTFSIPIHSNISGDIQNDFTGRVIYDFLEPAVADKLRDIAKSQGVSMFMLMFSLISLVLHKVTNEKSIALAVSASLRFTSGFEDSLGMYANDIALKSEYDSLLNLSEYLNKIKKICATSFSHINYPYNMLVNDIQSKGQEPLNITFSYESAELRTPIIDGVDFKPIEYMPNTQDYDITFDLQEKNQGIEINFSYRTCLFKEEEMKLLLGRYLLLINQIIENTNLKLSDINIITPKEKNKILNEFNDTTVKYPHDKTIVDMFEEQVEKTPYNIALQYMDTKLTYMELNSRANQLARQLIKSGVNKGDAVCLMAERSIDTIVSIYAIMKCGAAYMPVDPRFPEERIKYLLNDCKPKVILLGEYAFPKDNNIPILKIHDESLYSGDSVNLGTNIEPDDTVHLMYTSGTTGKPKGVISTHRGLVNRIDWMQSMYPMMEKDVILQKTTYTFDDSVYEILWSNMYGATLALLKPDGEMDVEEISRCIKRYGVSHILFVPTVLKELLYYVKQKKQEQDLNTLRLVVSSGEALTADLVLLFRSIFDQDKCILANLYGPTEVSIDATYYNCNFNEEGIIPIGKPIANTRIYILNDDSLCGIGWIGEICIGGVGVAKGYLNKPELTKEKFIKNPFSSGMLYRTGDLGYWQNNGDIVYCGRVDEQIKIRGQRVELGEIENAIHQLDGIKDTVVIVRKDENYNEAIYAYLIGDTEIKIKNVREELRVKLPEYMIPQYMTQIDKIPLASNGKVKRSELPIIEAVSSFEYVAPSSENEKVLCEAFEEVLGITKVGIKESFYDLGGDSIKAIKVVSKMRDIGYEIDIKEILAGISIYDMAKKVNINSGNNYEQGEVSGEIEKEINLMNFKESKAGDLSSLSHLINLPIKTGDEQVVRGVYQTLLKHHDILRAYYHMGKLVIMPYKDIKDNGLKVINLDEDVSMYDKITQINKEVQDTMDLEKGPLFKAVLYKAGRNNYLTVCAHKVIADEKSMDIILEDLKSALMQKTTNNNIDLPLKTASIIEWNNTLSEYINSKRIVEEKKYWDKVLNDAVKYEIYEKTEETLDDAGIEKINIVIPKDKTKLFLNEAQKAFNTNIKDFALSALGQAVSELTNLKKVTVMVENSGRDSLGDIINVDRTVGNFVTYYPIVFDVKNELDQMLIETKETIRKVPEKGFNYGLMYAGESQLHADILCRFNSFLDSESTIENTKVKYNFEKKGLEFPIILEFLVENEMVNIEFYCLKNARLIDFVKELSKSIKKYLVELIDYCINQDEQKKTVSDYGANDMTEEELGEILDLFS